MKAAVWRKTDREEDSKKRIKEGTY